jgi:hypothetical protein
MGTPRLVSYTVLGIFILGITIAIVPPPHWQVCELALAAAALLIVREGRSTSDAEAELRSTRDPMSSTVYGSAKPAYARARKPVR